MKLRYLRSASLCLLSAVSLLLPSAANSQTEDQFFSSKGVKIRYIVVGTGEPVILVHGFSGNLDVWRSLIADFSEDHEAIALDCRGHERVTSRMNLQELMPRRISPHRLAFDVTKREQERDYCYKAR